MTKIMKFCNSDKKSVINMTIKRNIVIFCKNTLNKVQYHTGNNKISDAITKEKLK